MHRLTAHAKFAAMRDRSFMADEAFRTDPHFPAVATALADASGWLEDAQTDADLRAAAGHGEALYASGVAHGDDIAEVANEIIVEVMAWCEQQGATCSRDS